MPDHLIGKERRPPASQPDQALCEKPFPDPDGEKRCTANPRLPSESSVTSFPSSSSEGR